MRARAFLLGTVLLTTAVRARADGDDPHAAAVAEFAAGRASFEAGDCATATKHFQRSLELEQSVGARYSLGECAARSGDLATAWNQYKAAEQLAIKKSDSARADRAHAAAAALDRKVVKVRLVLPAGPLTLSIDGTPVPNTEHWLMGAGYAIAAEAPHEIIVEVPGMPTWRRADVKGAAGVELPAIVVDIKATQEPSAKSIITRPTAGRSPPLRVASYAAAGGGVVAAGVATVATILAVGSRSDAKRACELGLGTAYPDRCSLERRADVDSANEAAKSQATVATIAAAVSLALLGSAGAMLLLSRADPQAAGSPRLFVGAGGMSGTF